MMMWMDSGYTKYRKRIAKAWLRDVGGLARELSEWVDGRRRRWWCTLAGRQVGVERGGQGWDEDEWSDVVAETRNTCQLRCDQ